MDEAMSRGTRTAVAAPGAVCDEAAFERHYSVEELTELWGMSDDFVRRLFLHEPGVVIFYRQQPASACIARCGSLPQSPCACTVE